MLKIDDHIHVTLEQLPPQGRFSSSSAENMIPHLDELGIEKAILMCGGETEGQLSPGMAGVADCEEICRRFPDRYAWMCNVSAKDPETLPQRLAAYKAAGAVGIGELAILEPITSPFLMALYAAAEKLELPVLFHMSPYLYKGYGVVDDPGLPGLEIVLKTFPQLTVIGHSQAFWQEMSGDAPTAPELRNGWAKGPVVPGGRIPQLLDQYPNLMCDLSANSGSFSILRDEENGLAFLEKYQDRLFFGTDMVSTQMVFPLGAWLDKMAEEGKLSQEAYAKICRENAIRVFHL